MATFIGDLTYSSFTRILLAPQTVTASFTGTGTDVSNAAFNYSLMATVATVGGTAPTFDLKLQEADALAGTYTDVPDGAFRQIVAADSGTVVGKLIKKSTKQFVRLVGTVAGTGPTAPMTVLLMAEPRNTGNPDAKGFSVSPAA